MKPATPWLIREWRGSLFGVYEWAYLSALMSERTAAVRLFGTPTQIGADLQFQLGSIPFSVDGALVRLPFVLRDRRTIRVIVQSSFRSLWYKILSPYDDNGILSGGS